MLFAIQNYLILSLYNIKSHAIFFKKYFNIFLQISLRLFKRASLFICQLTYVSFSFHPMYATYTSHFVSFNLITLMLISGEVRIVRSTA